MWGSNVSAASSSPFWTAPNGAGLTRFPPPATPPSVFRKVNGGGGVEAGDASMYERNCSLSSLAQEETSLNAGFRTSQRRLRGLEDDEMWQVLTHVDPLSPDCWSRLQVSNKNHSQTLHAEKN